MEFVKIIGALSWIVGLIFLFVFPPFGIVVLIVALVLTLYVRAKDREKKHAELLAATKESASPPPTVASTPSVTDRLATLDQLKEDGAVTDAEYEQKRKALLEEL